MEEGGQDSSYGEGESPLASKPGKKRPVLGGDDGGSDAGAGSTLFERMANLSRGSAPRPADDRDDDDDDTGGALNIPRFLGRQNNQ